MKLRQHAKGQPCVMCGKNDHTTVLHHFRIGNPGMGKKPPDWRGLELCHDCHHAIHTTGIDPKLQLIAYLRQIDRWIADGTMIVK